jgi:diguanylate cyclase (GGDEF)-like protein/PAS domain S-box-containing protein
MTTQETSHILIVDDTPLNIEILLGMLEGEHELSFATSGREALDLLHKIRRPDLILLDVMMPDMDGYAVCAALKADAATRDIPVIFVTASADPVSETRALSAGGVDFIHKPVNQAVLRARVSLHLELKRRALVLEKSLAEIALAHEQLKILWQAVEQSPTSIVITGRDVAIQYVNPYFTVETGYSLAEVLGQNPRILQSGLTEPSIYKEMWTQLQHGEPWNGELINRRKSGEAYWEEAHIAPVRDAQGRTTHYVAVKLNITDRKRAQERLAYMAHHDMLTNLPNRSLFFEHLDQALELARRNGGRFALLFIDLDHFKPVNDNHGHAVGDLLLQAVAVRMTDRVRASDLVGRIGGDEFVVLLRDVPDPSCALRVAEELRAALSQPFAIDGLTLSISASIGIALYPDHGADAIELARHADDAMYQAKQSGRDGLQLFEG